MTSKFLFWNLGKKDLGTLLELAVREHDVDFVILAECRNGPEEMLLALNRNVTRFHYHSGEVDYIQNACASYQVMLSTGSDGPLE